MKWTGCMFCRMWVVRRPEVEPTYRLLDYCISDVGAALAQTAHSCPILTSIAHIPRDSGLSLTVIYSARFI